MSQKNTVDRLIEELHDKVMYHNSSAEQIGGADARHNIIGNIVGFLPVWVSLKKLSEDEAKRVIERFNEEIKILDMPGVTWDELKVKGSGKEIE